MNTQTITQNITRIGLATGMLLLLPFFGMQVSDGVNWSVFDFVVMGTLVFGTGLMFTLLSQKLNTRNQKISAGMILIVLFLLAWVELAVGIFGTPFAGS